MNKRHLTLLSLIFSFLCAPLVAAPLVVIDPGHGGKHLGARSTRHSFEEKQFTLPTAEKLKEKLQRMGYRVRMTRTRDVFVSLRDRANYANKHHGDIFVSIHYNSAPNKPQIHGIEVYYFGFKDNRYHKGRTLAQRVLDQMLKQSRAHSRGTKPAQFVVLKETRMPSILVEGGFLTNAEERRKIKDPAYQDKLATGIARGIDLYFKGKH